MSQLSELLPKNYGYVVLAVAGGSLLNIRHMFAVAKARKEYGVKAPESYSAESSRFNCIMRAHMNYTEQYPFFATTTLLGGLQYPRVCATAGFVWLIARLMYARAYAADPSTRGRSFRMAMFAQMITVGCTVMFGVTHAGLTASCRALVSRR